MSKVKENTETTPLLDNQSPVAGSKFYFIEKETSTKEDRKVSN
jgi:hypothetical protein